MGEKRSVLLRDQWLVETSHLNSHIFQKVCFCVYAVCVSLTFLVMLRGQTVEEDHPQVKLNNLDNLKSIDSAICPFSVIALTPVSVSGLVHFNLDGLSRCYLLTAMEVV